MVSVESWLVGSVEVVAALIRNCIETAVEGLAEVAIVAWWRSVWCGGSD